MQPSRPARWKEWIAALVVPVLAFGSLMLFGSVSAATPETEAPRTEYPLYVPSDSLALDAATAASAEGSDVSAANAERLERLAATPTAIWLTPERHPIGVVGPYAQGLAEDATAQGAVPVFVVYGIPERDCGQFSAGGLSSTEEYTTWVAEIANALAGSASLVILEPDALSLSTQCENQQESARNVSAALDILLRIGLPVYLDGGHSNWLSVDEQAQLLLAAGVQRSRGFATNVSNYNSTSEERAYAEELSAAVGGAHYVIDVGRNGNGSNGEWCNPAGRAVGQSPGLETSGSRLDGLLWIKPPGESDGTCNGGPAAGQWWQARALEQTQAAGW